MSFGKKQFHRIKVIFRVYADFEVDNEIDISNMS